MVACIIFKDSLPISPNPPHHVSVACSARSSLWRAIKKKRFFCRVPPSVDEGFVRGTSWFANSVSKSWGFDRFSLRFRQGVQIQKFESRTPNPGFQTQESKPRNPSPGVQTQEFKPRSPNQESKPRNPNPGVQFQEFKPRDPNPGNQWKSMNCQ